MTAPGLEADGAPAAPAEGAEAVRAAVAVSRRGNDASRWPGKLPVADRLTVLLDPGSWREDGLLANAAAGELVVDAVVEPADLRAELIARLAQAEHWTRGPQRRHHHISPV